MIEGVRPDFFPGPRPSTPPRPPSISKMGSSSREAVARGITKLQRKLSSRDSTEAESLTTTRNRSDGSG